MLNELTPEQEAMIVTVREKWTHKCLHDPSFDEDECRKGVNWIYKLSGFEEPQFIVVDSPEAAQEKANELMGNKPGEHVYIPFASEGAISSAGWVSFYDYFQTIGVDLGERADNLNKLKALLWSGVYDMIQLDRACICIKKHIQISLLNGRLHNLDGPAITWRDGRAKYAVNGRILPAEIWTNKDNHTLETFMALENEEHRAAMIAVLGGERAVRLFGANIVSTEEKNGETIRLWKTDKPFAAADNNILAWVEVVCPSTSTHYYIDVNPACKTALEAVTSTWPGETPESYVVGQHT